MRPRLARALSVAGALSLSAAVHGDPPPPSDLCTEVDTTQGATLSASRDLYCVVLTARPGLEGMSGVVELGIPHSPFGVAVDAAGRHLYDAALTLEGLPAAGDLGPYRHYVAWLTTPVFDPVINLGAVENGRQELGRIDLQKFMVLITAEDRTDGDDWAGRLVLRGASPSARMSPPDMQEFLLGATGVEEQPTAMDHGMHGGAEDGWPRPPMSSGLTMLPALMALDAPATSPFLPEGAVEDLPLARPRDVVRLQDGGTLDLEAGLVRRRIRSQDYVMYGFNGQYPGPLIHVDEAATITVRFTNNVDWPTTIHWHGLRIDNSSDGVPGITQDPVAPGETFEYSVRFDDPGIYWYHPHHREDILKDLGLYGNMLVEPEEPDYYGPADREEVLMLDDFLMGPGGPLPFGRDRATHALMGRFGNLMLVNGEPDYALTVGAGTVVRFYLTNVSNTRTFNLSLQGARLKVVGTDVGAFEREEWVESVVLGPAERYVVHARFEDPGTFRMLNRVQGIDHLAGSFFDEVDTLGTVTVEAPSQGSGASGAGVAFGTLRANVQAAREIALYREYFDDPVDHELTFTLEADSLPFVVDRLMRFDSAYFHPVEWSGTMPMMNWNSTSREVRWILRDPADGGENMDLSWRFQVGDVVKIRLHNERRSFHAMQHPFHIHGQRFLVLAKNGTPNRNLAWKDTVLLPVGSTVDILLEITNPGRWMAHCHISEHLESGMRTVFTVEPQGGS
ncbi:MAG: multicopper oxidase family protein [Gemmatimonadota bacterium]|nr:multicopper oxidase family protein [Gemmatimonadota bacterium]